MIKNRVKLYDYRQASDLIYNTDYVSINDFGARLKSQLPDDYVFGATWHENRQASYSPTGNFDTDITFVGNVIVDRKRLDLSGGAFKKQATIKILKSLDEWTYYFRMKYYPNYSGCPAKNQEICSIREDVEKNELRLVHTNNGDFVFTIFSKDGVSDRATLNLGIDQANEPIEILFQTAYDKISETVYLLCYVDGELIANFILDTTEFSVPAFKEVVIGGCNSIPNFGISDFLVCNALIDNKEPDDFYTVGYEMPEHTYVTVPQRIEYKDYIKIESISNLKELATYDDSTFLIKYTFQLNGEEWFFDRTDLTWKRRENENGYTDLKTLLKYRDTILRQGLNFKLIPYLISIDGETTPTITTNVINYDEYIEGNKQFPVATVYGYVRDCFGQPIRNAKVRITPNKSTVSTHGNFIMAKLTKQVRTGESGYWDMVLPLTNALEEEFTYNMEIIVKEQVVFQRANIAVPEEGTYSIEDLIAENVDPEPSPIDPELKPIPNAVGMYYVELPDDEGE